MSQISDILNRATSSHVLGHWKEALSGYREILQTDPLNPDAIHLLGVLVAQSGNNELGVDLLQQAISLRPNVSTFYHNLGRLYEEQGMLDEAVEAQARSRELDPQTLDSQADGGWLIKSTLMLHYARGVDRDRRSRVQLGVARSDARHRSLEFTGGEVDAMGRAASM